MYDYQATLVRVIDGDTVVLDIDLGLSITHRITCRLAGINTPELPTEAGVASKIRLTELLTPSVDGSLIIQTTKDRKEKYGRYLVDLYVKGPYLGGTRTHVNAELVRQGYATAVKY